MTDGDKMKKIIEKYLDVIPYIVFGVLTTGVNIGIYWLMAHGLGQKVMFSTIVAWFAAVLFAYITNRKWVFHSKAKGFNTCVREMFSFFSCRLLTGVIDWGIMLLFVDILKFEDVIVKIMANILVIILNYVASKLIIFR